MNHGSGSPDTPPPSTNRAAWRALLGGALLGSVLMTVVLVGVPGHLARRLIPSGSTPWWIIAAMLVGAPMLSIAVHELGHLVTGLAQRFRFELFVVGPLGVRRDGDRVRAYLNRDWSMMGGIAATMPTADTHDVRTAFARVLLAGPIASLLLALLCVAILGTTASAWDPIVAFVGLTSIGIFAATTIPVRTGLFFTDRKRWQRLRSGGEDGQVELALLALVSRAAVDGHHRELALSDIARLQVDREPFLRFLGDAFSYLRARDRDDLAALGPAIDALETHRTGVSVSMFRMMGLPESPTR